MHTSKMLSVGLPSRFQACGSCRVAARCTMLTDMSIWTCPKAIYSLLDDLLDKQMIVANMCSVYEVRRSMHIWTELSSTFICVRRSSCRMTAHCTRPSHAYWTEVPFVSPLLFFFHVSVRRHVIAECMRQFIHECQGAPARFF